MSSSYLEAPLALPYTHTPIRRSIRIKTSKLPNDFFPQPSLAPSLQAELLEVSRTIATPSFPSRANPTRPTREQHRKVETARPSLQKTEDREALGEGRERKSVRLGRAERGWSYEGRKGKSVSLGERLKLPKIVNRGLFGRYCQE